MKKSTWIFCVVAATVLALVALPNTGEVLTAAGSPAVDIKIDNFSFTPPTLTVKAGTQITWTNGDDIPHTVVSDDQSFKSKCSTPTRSSRSRPASPARTHTSVRFTRR